MITQTWKCDGCGVTREIPRGNSIEGWWTGVDDEGDIIALACDAICMPKAFIEVSGVTGWSLADGTDEEE